LLERRYRSQFRREIERAYKKAAGDYLAGGESRMVAEMEEHREEIKDILGRLYGDSFDMSLAYVNEIFGKRDPVWIEKKESVYIYEADDVVTQSIIAFLRQRGLEMSITIEQTSVKELRNLIADLKEEGATELEIASQLEKTGQLRAPSRSITIARTEVGVSSSKSQFDLVRELPDLPEMVKEWDSSGDKRTRKTHKDAEKQNFQMPDGRFRVGRGDFLHPMESGQPKEEVINCRCVLNWVEVEDINLSEIQR